MSENDILVVSEDKRGVKEAFVKFRETFFDYPWVKRMFEYPHPMFELANGVEVVFITKYELDKKKRGWRGYIYPDHMIDMVIRSRYMC